jgi:alpha-tubulin suppressor-like RCC1 family protein
MVLQASAGHYNTLVVMNPDVNDPYKRHEVFQWGHGSCTPCRVNFSGSRARKPIDMLGRGIFFAQDTARITKVSAGRYHNVAVSSCGHVYSWGMGADKLGHGSREAFSNQPQLVEALLPENGGGRVVSLSASANR